MNNVLHVMKMLNTWRQDFNITEHLLPGHSIVRIMNAGAARNLVKFLIPLIISAINHVLDQKNLVQFLLKQKKNFMNLNILVEMATIVLITKNVHRIRNVELYSLMEIECQAINVLV